MLLPPLLSTARSDGSTPRCCSLLLPALPAAAKAIDSGTPLGQFGIFVDPVVLIRLRMVKAQALVRCW